MNPVGIAVAIVAICIQIDGHAVDDGLKNWFGDPFLQVASGLPDCPVPRGPFMTEEQMKSESHSRAERGTSCWMAGTCSKPNSYLYDPELADDVGRRLLDVPLISEDSVWVTVSRRIVYVQGCVAAPERVVKFEKVLKDMRDAEHVLIDVLVGTAGRPPYATRPASGSTQ